MRRIFITAAFVICTITVMAGCRKKADNIDISSIHTTAAAKETMAPSTAAPQLDTKSAKETTTADAAGTATKPATATTKASPKITSDIKTYTSSQISIQYPQITGLEDSQEEAQANKLLMDNALSVLQVYSLNQEQDTASIRCKLIQADRKLVSAVYTGTVSVFESSYPVNIFYTNTVDVSKGTDIGFDRYADSRSMAAYVLSPDCELMDISPELSASIREYLATQTADYYADIFNSADFPIKAADENGIPVFPQSFSYSKQGSIYFSVPLPHPLGDYVVVKFVPETK